MNKVIFIILYLILFTRMAFAASSKLDKTHLYLSRGISSGCHNIAITIDGSPAKEFSFSTYSDLSEKLVVKKLNDELVELPRFLRYLLIPESNNSSHLKISKIDNDKNQILWNISGRYFRKESSNVRLELSLKKTVNGVQKLDFGYSCMLDKKKHFFTNIASNFDISFPEELIESYDFFTFTLKGHLPKKHYTTFRYLPLNDAFINLNNNLNKLDELISASIDLRPHEFKVITFYNLLNSILFFQYDFDLVNPIKRIFNHGIIDIKKFEYRKIAECLHLLNEYDFVIFPKNNSINSVNSNSVCKRLVSVTRSKDLIKNYDEVIKVLKEVPFVKILLRSYFLEYIYPLTYRRSSYCGWDVYKNRSILKKRVDFLVLLYRDLGLTNLSITNLLNDIHEFIQVNYRDRNEDFFDDC